MRTFARFEREAPELAAAARRLLIGADGVAIGFLATASRDARPHLSPVCPIFAGERLYLSAVTQTPKVRDLRANPHYALHAFLGEHDEEIRIRGVAREVNDEAERHAVHEAIRFGAFDRSHPIFELALVRVGWVHWENAGQPDTRAVRRSWSAD